MPPRSDSGPKKAGRGAAGNGAAAGAPPSAAARLAQQGGALALMGLLELMAAAAVGHPLGIVAAALALSLGVGLLAVAACRHEAATSPSTPRIRLPRGTPAWVSAPPREAVSALWGLAGFVALLLLVRVASRGAAGPAAHAFPSACAKRFGCARVAETAPHRAGADAPLRLKTTLDAAQAAVAAFVNGAPRADVLYAGGDGAARAVHARFLSALFGFADDHWVRLACGKDGRVLVEAQGQLRLGVGDLGVNARRNKALFAALREADLPAGACATRWRRAGPGSVL